MLVDRLSQEEPPCVFSKADTGDPTEACYKSLQQPSQRGTCVSGSALGRRPEAQSCVLEQCLWG